MSWRDTIEDIKEEEVEEEVEETEEVKASGGWRDTIKEEAPVESDLGTTLDQGLSFGTADELGGVANVVGTITGESLKETGKDFKEAVEGKGIIGGALGAADEALGISKAGRAVGSLYNRLTGNTTEEETQAQAEELKKDSIPDLYREGRDEERAVVAKTREERPIASTLTELGGALGAAAPKAGYKVAGGLLKGARDGAALGAATGGAYGFGQAEGELNEQLGEATTKALLGGALGGAFGAAGGALRGKTPTKGPVDELGLEAGALGKLRRNLTTDGDEIGGDLLNYINKHKIGLKHVGDSPAQLANKNQAVMKKAGEQIESAISGISKGIKPRPISKINEIVRKNLDDSLEFADPAYELAFKNVKKIVENQADDLSLKGMWQLQRKLGKASGFDKLEPNAKEIVARNYYFAVRDSVMDTLESTLPKEKLGMFLTAKKDYSNGHLLKSALDKAADKNFGQTYKGVEGLTDSIKDNKSPFTEAFDFVRDRGGSFLSNGTPARTAVATSDNPLSKNVRDTYLGATDLVGRSALGVDADTPWSTQIGDWIRGQVLSQPEKANDFVKQQTDPEYRKQKREDEES